MSLASASAPGKLILFGEHAVVYGQPAIAACLTDLRIRVDVSSRTDGFISVDLPDLMPDPLCVKIPCDAFKALSKSDSRSGIINNTDFNSTLVEQGPPTTDDSNTIRQALTNLTKSNIISVHLSELHLSALIPLIYLIDTLQLLPSKTTTKINGDSYGGISIVVKSQKLPLGAGLGSSAAFSVAASAALYKLALSLGGQSNDKNTKSTVGQNNNGNKELKQPAKEYLDVINTLAFYSETLIHGTPSGIDNTVSCYGGALQYIKTKYGDTNIDNRDKKRHKKEEGGTTFIENFPQLNVILTNTNVPRSTKILVQGVRDLEEEYPAIADPIIDSIGNIARYD